MNRSDIKTISELLRLKGREDLGNLLSGCYSEIHDSGQYGSYLHSTISSFIIFAPLEQFHKLKMLPASDENLLLDAILDLHPHSDGSPEIVALEFRILQEDQLEVEAEKHSPVQNTITQTRWCRIGQRVLRPVEIVGIILGLVASAIAIVELFFRR